MTRRMPGFAYFESTTRGLGHLFGPAPLGISMMGYRLKTALEGLFRLAALQEEDKQA